MLRVCIWPGTCWSCNLQLLKVVFTADCVSIWCQQSLSLSLALMGSLIQLLQLLCAFHFTQGNCLSSVYNPHSHLYLFILFFAPSHSFLTFFFGLSAALSLVLPIIEGLSTLIHCVWQVCGKRLLLPIIVLVTAVFFTHSASYQDR